MHEGIEEQSRLEVAFFNKQWDGRLARELDRVFQYVILTQYPGQIILLIEQKPEAIEVQLSDGYGKVCSCCRIWQIDQELGYALESTNAPLFTTAIEIHIGSMDFEPVYTVVYKEDSGIYKNLTESYELKQFIIHEMERCIAQLKRKSLVDVLKLWLVRNFSRPK